MTICIGQNKGAFWAQLHWKCTWKNCYMYLALCFCWVSIFKVGVCPPPSYNHLSTTGFPVVLWRKAILRVDQTLHVAVKPGHMKPPQSRLRVKWNIALSVSFKEANEISFKSIFIIRFHESKTKLAMSSSYNTTFDKNKVIY